jgi:hypothetical protein
METFWAEEYAKHGLNISGYNDEEYGSENVAVAFAAARAITPANRQLSPNTRLSKPHYARFSLFTASLRCNLIMKREDRREER